MLIKFQLELDKSFSPSVLWWSSSLFLLFCFILFIIPCSQLTDRDEEVVLWLQVTFRLLEEAEASAGPCGCCPGGDFGRATGRKMPREWKMRRWL